MSTSVIYRRDASAFRRHSSRFARPVTTLRLPAIQGRLEELTAQLDTLADEWLEALQAWHQAQRAGAPSGGPEWIRLREMETRLDECLMRRRNLMEVIRAKQRRSGRSIRR